MYKFFPLLLVLVTVLQAYPLPELIVFTEREQEAAEELKMVLTEITGRSPKLIPDGQQISGKAFYLGKTCFAAEKGLDFSGYGPEEWLVRSYGADVVIGGGARHGTLYGVYELLERHLGCRWLAWDTAVIPRNEKPVFTSLNYRDQPDFDSREVTDDYYRSLWRGKDIFQRTQRHRKRIRSSIDFDRRFAVWPRTSRQYYDCHNFYSFVSPKKYFKTHPEYFSMDQSGRRVHGTIGETMQGANFCMTNPAVRDIAYSSLVNYIRKDRSSLPREQWPDVYDMSPMDTSRFLCLCPECEKITRREGAQSGLLLDFLNDMARRLARDYPGVQIRSLAYSITGRPPRHIRPEKNIFLRWCNLYGFNDCYRPITSAFNASQKAQLDAWGPTGARIHAYEYWNMGGQFFNPPRVETMVDALAPNLRYYKKHGVTGYFAEFGVNSDWHMQNFAYLQLYVGYRLMVDVTLDPEQLIREFMTGFYGPAAQPMTVFLNMLRTAVRNEKVRMRACTENDRPYCTQSFMEKVLGLLLEARRLTVPGSLYRRHVELELPSPLFVALSHTEWELAGRDGLIQLYRDIRSRIIETAYGDDATGKRLKKELRADFRQCQMNFIRLNLPVPSGFAGRDARMFGWPKLSWYKPSPGMWADDPVSSTGRALVSYCSDPKKKSGRKYHDLSRIRDDFSTPLDFGAYDYTTRQGIHWHFDKRIPKDEKYHWYRVGTYNLNKGTFVWGLFWTTRCDVSSLWKMSDGFENLNVWEIWVSVRITGPAYVKGSELPDEIYWDQVMLVRPKGWKLKKLAQ